MSAIAAVSSQPDSETLRSAVTLEADLRPPTLAEPSSAPPARLSHTADLIQRPQKVSRVFMLLFFVFCFIINNIFENVAAVISVLAC